MQNITVFNKAIENRHEYAREWKARTGSRVVGGFCTYVPEEIIYAAGMLPVRVLGSHEPQDVTERYLYTRACPFSRDCLAQGLHGRYAYLDGIVMSKCCAHQEAAFDSWRANIPIEFAHWVNMPVLPQSPHAAKFLASELLVFRQEIERWTGRAIPDDALVRAIDAYDLNRQMLRELYELRRERRPAISGTEAMQITLSSQLMDKAEHNRFLAETLADAREAKNRPDPGARLMLIGSEDDDVEFVRFVESLGATVVIDDHCTGSRYFWDRCQPSATPIDSIATRYVERVPCPIKDIPAHRRDGHILKLLADYSVNGVIFFTRKFCDPFAFDRVHLGKMLKERDIPYVELEYDIAVDKGQVRTRVEALVEMIELQLM